MPGVLHGIVASSRRVASSTAYDTILVGSSSSPHPNAYPWQPGFGTRYTAPATPASAVCGAAFSPNGACVALAAQGISDRVAAFPWTQASGFGTKYTSPTVTNFPALAVGWAPSGTQVAAVTGGIDRANANGWAWSDSSGFGTKYTSVNTNPIWGMSFAPSGNNIAVAQAARTYPWTSTGYGTAYSNPATMPSGNTESVAFASTEIAFASSSSPYISAYPWSAGFGTKFSNPGTAIAGVGVGVVFSSDWTVIAVASQTSPYLQAYAWSSSGFGTAFSNPGTAVGGVPSVDAGTKPAFARGNAAIAVPHATSPYISSYAWSSSGFGSKYSDPGNAIAGTGQGVAFGTIYS